MVNFEEGLSVKDFKTRPLPMLRADTAMYVPSQSCELRVGAACPLRVGAACPHAEWSFGSCVGAIAR